MMPWKVLGIEQEGASERDVKRAYARLLKKHRPEEDLEGFTRVHEAYQEALNELRWAKEFGDMHAIDHLPPRQAPDIVNDSEQEHVHPPLPHDTSNSAPPDMPPPKLMLVKDVEIDKILAALEAGKEQEPIRVLNAIQFADKSNLRIKFAKAILAEPARFANDVSTQFSRRLAMLIAFRNPHLSERLLNMLFQHLAPNERQYILAAPTWLLDAAPLFKSVINNHHWDFWCAAFADPDRIDWDSPLARFALGAVDRLETWEGYEMIDQIVPEEKQLWNQRARPIPHPPPKIIENRGGLILAAIFLIGIAFNAGTEFLEFFNPSPEPEPVAPMLVFEQPGWTKQTDLGRFFMDAQSQESIEVNGHQVQVLGKRAYDGSLRYTAVLGNYVREFPSRTAYVNWRDQQQRESGE